MTLLERTVADADRRLVLLAPPDAEIPETFGRVLGSSRVHARLLQEVQQLRGRIYLEDGAVDADQLSAGGLHRTPEDDRSWHLVSLDAAGAVVACAWYRLHDATASFRDLRIRHSPLADAPSWRDRLWHAVESDLLCARKEGLGYAELGGWAIDKANRCRSEILLIVCAAYGLSRALGDAIGLTTATVRHSSAKILRRLGGSPMMLTAYGDPVEVPPYFDPQYGCTMELLRFDSRAPHPDLSLGINLMREKFVTIPVVLNDYADLIPAAGESPLIPQYAA